MKPSSERRLAREARRLLRHDHDLLTAEERSSLEAALAGIDGRRRPLEHAGAGEGELAAADFLIGFCRARRGSPARQVFAGALALVVLLVTVRTFFVQTVSVVTGSMEPTLQGERWEAAVDPDVAARSLPTWPARLRDRILSGHTDHFVRARFSGIAGEAQPQRHWPLVSFQSISIGARAQTIWLPPRVADPVFGLRLGWDSPWPTPGVPVVAGDWLLAGRYQRGDRVLIDRVTFNFRRPRRGEVALLEARGLPGGSPDAGGEPYAIKRVMGLPGDSLRVTADVLGASGRSPGPAASNGAREIAVPAGPVSVGAGRWSVRPGNIFLMGDNAAGSVDSRSWGDLPVGWVAGRCVGIYWPFDRVQSLGVRP